MKANRWRTSISALAGMSVILLWIFSLWGHRPEERYLCHISGNRPEAQQDALEHLREDFTLLPEFSSHLPLVIIDTGGKEILQSHIWNADEGYAQPVPGVEAYVQAQMQVYDNSEGLNSLSESPDWETTVKIKRRGNSSMSHEKAQYKLHLLTETGENRYYPLLGMDSEYEWILNGFMTDLSQIRNYLAFTLAAEVMPYVPDVRYCEVVLKENGEYRYQGIYLMMESVKRGEGRVEIKGGQESDSYLVRRDRYDPEANMLSTWATEQGLTAGYFSLLYPGKNQADATQVSAIEGDLSMVEQMLYADNPDELRSSYRYIDMDSFIDYFLVNEYLTNYDAGTNSTYLYKDTGKKLAIGPVWDFDDIADNFPGEALEPQAMAFHRVPWFERLVQDKYFIERLIERSDRLSRSTFRPEHVEEIIDSTIQYLGPASQRNYARWVHIYSENSPYGLPDDGEFKRQSDTYQQELVKLKHLLRRHHSAVQQRLPELYEETDITVSGARLHHLVFIGLAMAVFIASVRIGRQRVK